MNKGILIIAAVVLLGGGIGYAMMNRTSNTNPIQTNTTNESSNTVMEVKSLRDLMTVKENQTCTFTDTTTGNNGVVYITNGSMRGDFTMIANGTSSGSHMIVADDSFYVWTDGQTQGFKSSIAQFENTPNNPNASQTIDINKQVDYVCNDWSVDSSKFQIPTDIEFMDMTSIMESIPTSMVTPADTKQETSPGTASNDQCASCDNVPASYKTQCLQALNCN